MPDLLTFVGRYAGIPARELLPHKAAAIPQGSTSAFEPELERQKVWLPGKHGGRILGRWMHCHGLSSTRGRWVWGMLNFVPGCAESFRFLLKAVSKADLDDVNGGAA